VCDVIFVMTVQGTRRHRSTWHEGATWVRNPSTIIQSAERSSRRTLLFWCGAGTYPTSTATAIQLQRRWHSAVKARVCFVKTSTY